MHANAPLTGQQLTQPQDQCMKETLIANMQQELPLSTKNLQIRVKINHYSRR